MHRVLAVLPLLILAFAPVSAQKDGAVTAQKDASGAVTWKMRTGSTSYHELLALYGQARGLRVMYDQKKVAGEVYCTVPEEGQELSGDGIDLFVQDALGEQRLAIMRREHGTAFVVPQVEALASARVVTMPELEITSAAEWVTCTYPASHVEANQLRGLLQHHFSRNGGSVNPVPGFGGSLAITDRCDRVRQLVKLLRQLDVPGFLSTVARRYDLPEGVEPAAAKQVVEQLFPATEKAAPPHDAQSVTAAAVPGKRAIIVRAAARDHEQIAEVIGQLK